MIESESEYASRKSWDEEAQRLQRAAVESARSGDWDKARREVVEAGVALQNSRDELEAAVHESREDKVIEELKRLRGGREAFFGENLEAVSVAKIAWEEGLMNVVVRLPKAYLSPAAVKQPMLWTDAIAQITDIGWQLHTWTVVDNVAMPMFARPT